MEITRRDLLRWATVSAAGIALGADSLARLQEALAAPGAPPIVWLQGASCTGCSISLLNATSVPIERVLTQTVDLRYQPNLIAAYGEPAISSVFATAAEAEGRFVLCVEGAVPTGAGGRYCVIGERGGVPLTILDAARELGPKAARVVAVGTCASFGGVAGASTRTGAGSVSTALAGTLSAPVVNLPGCPAHPDTVLTALVSLVTGSSVPLDGYGRPASLFGGTVHSRCPRRESEDARIGAYGCYKEIGCRGPDTVMSCPAQKWNAGRNWCVGARMACIGCASPSFPRNPLLGEDDEDEEEDD